MLQYFVESVLGVRECDPKHLSVPKRRAEVLEPEDHNIAHEVAACGIGLVPLCETVKI